MKAVAFVLLLAICSIDCRKVVQINKNANIDFINMEIGGGVERPSNVPVRQPASVPAPNKPQTPELSKPGPVQQPKSPVPAVTTAKPVPVAVPHPSPVKPTPSKPAQPLPNQMDLKPVPAKPGAAGGVTTPGPGNVKQLVTFYNSQGNASVIRPYSYSQAVKQG